ncbi:MAG: proton-dependent oligopeptide transporter, POT family [Bacteroidetes bacterium]|nr:MAG: proton-dependent oligopeptide transporter, POT family [Bacteroidota bacterium]
MSEQPTTARHPKGLYLLFATEMWERFNFYGMRAILSLFLVNALAYSDAESSVIYGGFLGLCYLTPMLGGFVADKYLGNRTCIQLGGLMMGVGQLLLFFSATVYASNVETARMILWTALGIIILGNGFFKPNISSMVGSLYPKGDSRLDSAFTIFYMGINLGAFIGMNICAIVGDVKDKSGMRDISAFKWGFLAASIAMILGVVIFRLWKHKYIVTPEGKAIGAKPSKAGEDGHIEQAKFTSTAVMMAVGFAVGLICLFHFVFGQNWIYAFIYSSGLALAGLIMTDKSLTKVERDRILVIYIIGFFVIFFWACFEQAGSSLTFIADKQTDTNILGWQMPPSLVQNFNSIFVIALAPLFGILWIALNKRKLEPISPVKQAIGLFILALGYLLIASQVKGLGGTKLGVIWLILMYFLHTIGELCLSPIGLSLVSKLAPARFSSLLMGVFFLSNASGYALAGTLGALYPPDVAVEKQLEAKEFTYLVAPAHDTVPEVKMNVKNDSAFFVKNVGEPLDVFNKTFDQVLPAGQKDSVLMLKPGIASWTFDTLSVKDEKGKTKIELRGLKNNFGATTASIPLYKFKQIANVYFEKVKGDNAAEQANIDAKWTSSTDERRSQFGFSSDGKTFVVWEKGKITLWNLDPPKPKFMGFEIHNLYEFFMVFVLLPGIAALLLFLISPLLKKMMHGVR